MKNILADEKDFARFAAKTELNKPLPKPSLLYILTGLGRYSWYRIPFVKGVFCVSIPAWLISRFHRLIGFRKGKCSCAKGTTCFFIGFLGLTVGLCEKGKERLMKGVEPMSLELFLFLTAVLVAAFGRGNSGK